MTTTVTPDSQRIATQQRRHQSDEFRSAVRALLMAPLMGPADPALPQVRRHADALRDWFRREAGWPLRVERDGARLYKRPADLGDASRGLPRFDRARYVLLCLACAVLERAEAQISLRTLGERLLQWAGDSTLAARGYTFTLDNPAQRRDLVQVCQTLLRLGVLERVAGDEEGYVQSAAQRGDALYDLRRAALAGLLAAVRGPSSWPVDAAPTSLDERLAALVTEHAADTDEARRSVLRHRLARRLLDDPVVYADTLDEAERAYFINQRGSMAARLAEATGLTPELRAEGCALTDDDAQLSDIALPAEGTEAHAALLVAEHLAQCGPATESEVATFLHEAKARYGRYWRKSAREDGGEHELAALALLRLQQLHLLRRDGERLQPLPAIARYAVAPAELKPAPQAGLFDQA